MGYDTNASVLVCICQLLVNNLKQILTMSAFLFDRKLSTPWHIVIVFDRSQYYRETAALYFSGHLLLETHWNPPLSIGFVMGPCLLKIDVI